MSKVNKKQEVSRGLKSLLGNIERSSNVAEKAQWVKELSNKILMVKIEDIEINPFQPRSHFDETLLKELSDSIKVSGLIQPITVRSLGGEKYQLISGERRFRASMAAGLTELPAYVRVANDQEMLEMALVENIQRADLNALEVALSYQRLMEECNLTHEQLSDRVGKDRSTVTNYVRLLKLPVPIQSSLKEGHLSMGHARALAGVEEVTLQLELFRQVIHQGLSVRALEALIKAKNNDGTSHNASTRTIKDANITQLEQDLKKSLGYTVEIKRNKMGKGTIHISFNDDEALNNICERILTQV